MSKNIGSIFFTLIFVTFLVAPTIIRLIDDSIDISIIYTTSEEGENSGEKNKDIEILFFDLSHNLDGDVLSKNDNTIHYYFKNYIKPHLNLIFPPPEITL